MFPKLVLMARGHVKRLVGEETLRLSTYCGTKEKRQKLGAGEDTGSVSPEISIPKHAKLGMPKCP